MVMTSCAPGIVDRKSGVAATTVSYNTNTAGDTIESVGLVLTDNRVDNIVPDVLNAFQDRPQLFKCLLRMSGQGAQLRKLLYFLGPLICA